MPQTACTSLSPSRWDGGIPHLETTGLFLLQKPFCLRWNMGAAWWHCEPAGFAGFLIFWRSRVLTLHSVRTVCTHQVTWGCPRGQTPYGVRNRLLPVDLGLIHLYGLYTTTSMLVRTTSSRLTATLTGISQTSVTGHYPPRGGGKSLESPPESWDCPHPMT